MLVAGDLLGTSLEHRMHVKAKKSVIFLGAALFAGFAAPAAMAGELPTRKGGLWQQKTTMDQGDGPRDHTLTICIDEKMERQTAAASVKHHKDNCSKYEIKVVDGTTNVEAECVFNKRPLSSSTQMSGDFATTFNIKIENRTTLSDRGQTRIMKRTIEQAGSYLNEDCGELKPGEAMGSNGEKVLVQ
jgi:Protein of unknown function (DUF3617)